MRSWVKEEAKKVTKVNINSTTDHPYNNLKFDFKTIHNNEALHEQSGQGHLTCWVTLNYVTTLKNIEVCYNIC